MLYYFILYYIVLYCIILYYTLFYYVLLYWVRLREKSGSALDPEAFFTVTKHPQQAHAAHVFWPVLAWVLLGECWERDWHGILVHLGISLT